MEIENVDTNKPPVEEKEKESSEGGKSKDIWVILLNVLLALITVLLLAYVAYKNGYIDLDNVFNSEEETNTEEENTDETLDEEEVVVDNNGETTVSTYEGDVITAVIPDGWSIVEYTDGDGTDMLVDNVIYTGLTGLRVFNGEKEILHLYAVSGIGFVGCSQLPIFDDSSEEYLQENEDMNAEVEMEMDTVDYTDTSYTDFEWMDKDFRRVGTYLYYDTVEGNDYFEPQCERGLVTVPGLVFEDGDGYEGTAYFYEINEEATSDELGILDSILISMVAN